MKYTPIEVRISPFYQLLFIMFMLMPVVEQDGFHFEQ